MKKVFLGLAVCGLLATTSIAVPQNKSFSGEIMDEACASQDGHASMKGKDETDEQCTRSCVKAGSKYVLYDAATKTTYKLDDQQKPDAFAGAKVVVTGTFDKASGTIHVAAIKAAK
jgi:hypothetical protein